MCDTIQIQSISENDDSSNNNYTDFLQQHRNQLIDTLQIPEPLIQHLHVQLQSTFVLDNHGLYDTEHAIRSFQQQLISIKDSKGNDHNNTNDTSEYGAILVLPHAVSWDMLHGRNFMDVLQKTNYNILKLIWDGLQKLQPIVTDFNLDPLPVDNENDATSTRDNKDKIVNAIVDHPMFWSRVLLFRSKQLNTTTTGSSVCATILSPPYLPHVTLSNTNHANENLFEADCTGPFPFHYHHPFLDQVIDLSLLYISPEGIQKIKQTSSADPEEPTYLPTIDLVPAYQYPNHHHLRMVRYTSLLYNTREIPDSMIAYIKESYATFVQKMHLVRQNMLRIQKEQLEHMNTIHASNNSKESTVQEEGNHKVYRVYTDTNDPMELKHPIVGLESNSVHFKLVDNIEDADIVYSYQSIYAPNYIHYQYIQQNKDRLFINQFPYEGAFVQKDHLSRGILQQHGLPRPIWSLETYDLDVHFTELVGSTLCTIDEINKHNTSTETQPPLWIIKPASGTQSQGHVVTSSLSHILRINDAFGGHRVAQKYIARPVCINNHKVDCRVIVLMTSAGKKDSNGHIIQLPTLFMHNTCYFRIASKPHNIRTPLDRCDHESVLTASHLLHIDHRTTSETLRKLPCHADTVHTLEMEYPNAFVWDTEILPQIQTMICELFNGMTNAYTQMIESKQSRAVYGVDVMFQIDDNNSYQNDDDNNHNITITPKLLEVTFCPANNAICDAYIRDEALYRSYNKEIFECLFLNIISNNITQLQ
jgi:hypothetical protein